jgi:hypothetical protein
LVSLEDRLIIGIMIAPNKPLGFFSKQMKIGTIARRLVSPAPSLMLIVCFASVGRAQQTDHDILSNADKSEIVASALKIVFGTRGLIHMTLSSENIEFVDSSRMSEMGFALASAGQVRDWERSRFGDYVVFKRIASNDGVVSVVLWQITQSYSVCCWPTAPIFSCGHVSRKRNYTFTFEFNKETGEWIGQRVYRPMLQFQGSNKLFAKP